MRFTESAESGPWFAALFVYQGDYIPMETVREVTEWCTEQFGPMCVEKGKWIFSGRVIAFRDSDAGFCFKLRWC